MKLKLNISPCPNDTFMFDALINARIDTCGLEFDVGYHDIEQLNLRAKKGEADITKISYAILPQITGTYALCDSGSAMGRGNGPLLVAREGNEHSIKSAMQGGGRKLKVAVPGLHTTANMLMERLFPRVENKTETLFSDIADGVASGRFDAGVLIHEGRFTYRGKGLGLVYDLGLEWESQTCLPLPLGGIALSRDIPVETAVLFSRVLRGSIEYAFDNPRISREYIKFHAQEMDDKVIESHIALFVNEYSLSPGEAGTKAVKELTGLDPAVFY